MNAERVRLEDQLLQVESDLDELDGQETVGEIDAATAARLRARYRAEADSLQERLIDAGPEPDAGAGDEPGATPGSPPPGRSRTRVLVGAAILVVGAVVIAAAVVVSTTDGGSNLTAGVVDDVAGDSGVGLAEVGTEEMETVVAANPGVVGMRLALARRYFEAGDFQPALDHYMTVLAAEQSPEALANVGWMTYLSDRPDVALDYVERALEIEPEFVQAYWFLANIRFALGDTAGAIAPLERLLRFDDIPDDIRREAEGALADLRDGS